MRIGVDGGCWLNQRGYGRFTRELLRVMVSRFPEHEFVFFADPWTRERLDLVGRNVSTVAVGQSRTPSRAAASGDYRPPLDMLKFGRAVWKNAPDVFFFPSVYTYFPLPLRLPAVVVVHDAIAERFPHLTLPSWRDRLFWRLKVRMALWQARLVLTISDYSARELSEVLKLPPERIRVTSEAPAQAFNPSDDRDQVTRIAGEIGLPSDARWLIYVGGFNPHKHVDVIVRAHAAVAANHKTPPLYLLLVGSVERDVFHGSAEKIRATIEEFGTGDLVKWTGYLPDEQLRHLHSGSIALLLPSACEGFGLPAVEAAACGSPVVATTESPLPELLGGGGIFVPPGDEGALVAALETLINDEAGRLEMGAVARKRAAELNWEDSADTTLHTLVEATQ